MEDAHNSLKIIASKFQGNSTLNAGVSSHRFDANLSLNQLKLIQKIAKVNKCLSYLSSDGEKVVFSAKLNPELLPSTDDGASSSLASAPKKRCRESETGPCAEEPHRAPAVAVAPPPPPQQSSTTKNDCTDYTAAIHKLHASHPEIGIEALKASIAAIKSVQSMRTMEGERLLDVSSIKIAKLSDQTTEKSIVMLLRFNPGLPIHISRFLRCIKPFDDGMISVGTTLKVGKNVFELSETESSRLSSSMGNKSLFFVAQKSAKSDDATAATAPVTLIKNETDSTAPSFVKMDAS
jgi:hypothetical protein